MGQGAHKAKDLASVAGEKVKLQAAKHDTPTLRNVKDVFKELQAGCQSGYKKEAEAVVQPSNGQPEQSSQMHVFVQRSLADRW
ncbi:hypothetical protein Y032_0658g1252 [Ancylostoma ceylanicum]|uniref:Uncharacterized protein n=1 Tax=Ancylostoma ceylanicum TaxID=53326 RepID=A0A016WIB1_9BILA|nr:hypothetical protein Y032_0658g1252 [Ancylostoma ceylanicum]